MRELKNLSEKQLILIASVLNVTQTYINHVALEMITPTNQMRDRILRTMEQIA